ncbi:MAG: hypothetical protein IJC21_07950 [Lentisphaeria bacterium]|nr:hypothetical protein [Lentisphaeria bacterium]
MKHIFTILLVSIFVSTLAAADFRIDISGINGTAMKPVSASAGATLSQASWRGKKKSLHLSCIVQTENEWKKYSFSFVPLKDGAFYINLMSSSPKAFFACDNITVSGAVIKNGDFELLNDKKEPESWYKMKTPRFSSTDGINGSNCTITAHNDRWHQLVKCKKGELVTITFYARSIK